jgi:hypothetical protein
MVVRLLDVKKDHFHPREDDEEILGPEVLYLSAIGALMYLANCTRPNIAFTSKIQFYTNSKALEWGQTCSTLSLWNN